MSSDNYKTDQAIRERHRCQARVRRGTDTEFCEAVLDERGECPNAGQHVEE